MEQHWWTVAYDNGTNVGIGTTAPTQKLDVAGKIQMQTGAVAGYVPVSDATGTMTWTDPASLSITETDPQVSSATANYIPKWNGTTLVDGVAYDNGTNVGIGTTTPGNLLDVNGSLGISFLNVYNKVTGTNAIQMQGSAGIDQWINFRRGGGAPVGRAGTIFSSFAASHFFTHNNGGTYTIAYSTENTDNPSIDLATGYFVITSAANTGVNITAPTSTLHVNGAFATTVKTAQVAGTNNPDNTAAVWIYSSGTGTITLPGAGTCSGRRYVIVNQTGASVTTSAYINLATASVTALANNSSIEVISDATNWRQIK
ncbi:MAG: hypothetical protein IPH78_10535 [Bacteroidetes bacterium]|nr:hypothetical protein [Bacteroidota bacterium]